MFKRILIVLSLIVLVAAMVGGTTTLGLAQTQEPCPEGTGPYTIVRPQTGEVETGCGNVAPEGPASCLSDFEFIPEYSICFKPYGVVEEPPPDEEPPPPPLTKEACKEDFAARGFENQGQCIKAVNQANK